MAGGGATTIVGIGADWAGGDACVGAGVEAAWSEVEFPGEFCVVAGGVGTDDDEDAALSPKSSVGATANTESSVLSTGAAIGVDGEAATGTGCLVIGSVDCCAGKAAKGAVGPTGDLGEVGAETAAIGGADWTGTGTTGASISGWVGADDGTGEVEAGDGSFDAACEGVSALDDGPLSMSDAISLAAEFGLSALDIVCVEPL